MEVKLLLILLFIFLLFLSFYLYFILFPQKSPEEKRKESLIYNETYVQERINDFLRDNPTASESYARDVVYHEIAIAEKNSTICEKITTEWLKQDCYNYLRVRR